MTLRLLMAVFLVLPAMAQTEDSKADLKTFVKQLSSVQKGVEETYLRRIEATKRKDVDATVAFYTDDAVVLPDGQNTASGKEAIREFYKGWYGFSNQLVNLKIGSTGMVMNGSDMVIQTADFSGVSSVEGKEVPFRGKNLIVWKRQVDGSWKILRDIWNGSPVDAKAR